MRKTDSKFIRKLLKDLNCPESEQAQLVSNLKDFYRRMGGNALQVFEGRLRRFIKSPNAHLGFVSEVTFAGCLLRHDIPHSFLPEAETPTPDIEAVILDRKVYFEIKSVEEDHYMVFIENVQEQIEQLASASGCQVTIIPVYIKDGREDSLVTRIVLKIQDALSKGDYGPIQHEDQEGNIYVLFSFDTVSFKPSWRFTRPDCRTVHDTPFLNYKLTKTLNAESKQFERFKPTFLVWYTWDESLWDHKTQRDFRVHISRLLEQRELAEVAGIIVAAPRWAFFENQLNTKYSELKHIGLFSVIRNLQ